MVHLASSDPPFTSNGGLEGEACDSTQLLPYMGPIKQIMQIMLESNLLINWGFHFFYRSGLL